MAYRCFLLYMGLVFLGISGGTAQEPLEATDVQTESSPPSAESTSSSENTAGDIVTLKNGKILKGVQIFQETPLFYEIEVYPGVPLLQLPRRQVESVSYDDLSPRQRRRKSDVQQTQETYDIIHAEELAPAFYRKLTAPLSEEPLSFKAIDLQELLKTLATRTEIMLEMDENLSSIPPEHQTLDVEIAPGTSLHIFLQKTLSKQIPGLQVLTHYEKLLVQYIPVDSAQQPTEKP